MFYTYWNFQVSHNSLVIRQHKCYLFRDLDHFEYEVKNK